MAILLLFDIDGTLINSAGSGRMSLKGSIESITGKDCSKQIDFSFMGKTDRFIVERILNNLEIKINEDIISQIKIDYLKKLRMNLERNLQKRQISGIHDFLMEVRKKDEIKISLQTGNFKDGAFIKLESLGLDSYFNTGGFGDKWKDRNGVVHEGIRESEAYYEQKFPPENIIVIGDTPADIISGKNYKTRTLAICSRNSFYNELKNSGPDLIIENFNNIDKLNRFIYNGTKIHY